MLLNRENFALTQSVVRWAGIGVLPAANVAQVALDAVRSGGAKAEEVKPITHVLQQLLTGVLPLQESCIDAAKVLAAHQMRNDEFSASAPSFGA